MTGKIKPCMSILPPPQKRLWPELMNAQSLGFTLYGGTAIALRLGHRLCSNSLSGLSWKHLSSELQAQPAKARSEKRCEP